MVSKLRPRRSIALKIVKLFHAKNKLNFPRWPEEVVNILLNNNIHVKLLSVGWEWEWEYEAGKT